MSDSRIYHKIVNNILELIDTGVYPVGCRLPSERDLAATFGVSRARIREAQIVLEVRGRLKVKVSSGAYVLDGSDYNSSNPPKFKSIELIEARAIFGTEAAALAAPMITDNTILELERLVEIMTGKVKNEMTPNEAGAAFHYLIAAESNNRAIMYIIDSMWKRAPDVLPLQNASTKVNGEDNNDLEDECYAILKALKNRNPAATRKAMRAHFTRMIKALLVVSEEEAYQEMSRKISENRSRFLLSAQLS